MKTKICAVICAAGKGERAGFAKNKLLVPYQGSCALEKTLSAFDYPSIDEIVVTASENDFNEISALCKKYENAKAVLGGSTRPQSVYNALQATDADIVLIHDGARPFVTREVIDGCIQSVKSHGSGICAIDCTDTLARTENGKIVDIPPRAQMKHIQTPQGFFRENIAYAYAQAFENENAEFTDDSSVFSLYCGKPHICAGARGNIKLTYAEDFQENNARCGFGIDTHAFGKEQDYIVLAGVKIPSHSGLIAHSDGDVLVHALMDALLSACGLKDIGYYFPDSDAKWKNANSMQMLALVKDMVSQKGYQTQNVSIAIQAEKPRLAKYIDDMKNSLCSALKIDPTRVGITAGTNEGLGYVGEGKGITVHAYVLLSKEIKTTR